jgi:hypothetical protein
MLRLWLRANPIKKHRTKWLCIALNAENLDFFVCMCDLKIHIEMAKRTTGQPQKARAEENSPVNDDQTPVLLKSKEASVMLGMSASYLAQDRMRKHPMIPFVKVGHRAVRYALEDIFAHIAKRRKK